ncbi:MAG: DNA polymerase III, delta' subunit protein [uncultured bacterium]|nr:MAG: DNA polymerase III, delta' subunit protein [uncultured bacterium]
MVYPNIISQKRVKDLLTQVFINKKIPHCLLFLGDKGSQNVDMAHEFAMTILCDNPNEQYCGKCESCRLSSSKTHPDFLTLKPSGKIRQMKKEAVSDFIKFLNFKSYRGGYKVVVIEDCDRLSDSSANALLKSLEEPPGYSVIILTTNQLSNLLPTIISRCQLIEFLPLREEEILEYVEKQAISQIPPELMVKLSAGHVGNISGEIFENLMVCRNIAFSIIEDWMERGNIGIIEGAEKINDFLESEKKVLEKEITGEIKQLKEESAEFKKRKEEELNANVSGILKDKLDSILQVFSDFFRDVLLIKENVNQEFLKNIDKTEIINKVAFKLNHIDDRIQHLDLIRRRLQGTVNQKLALEALFLKLFS